MTTGPEHFRQAERFLGYAHELYEANHEDESIAASWIAQAHATLALAAATAAQMMGNHRTAVRVPPVVVDWASVLDGAS